MCLCLLVLRTLWDSRWDLARSWGVGWTTIRQCYLHGAEGGVLWVWRMSLVGNTRWNIWGWWIIISSLVDILLWDGRLETIKSRWLHFKYIIFGVYTCVHVCVWICVRHVWEKTISGIGFHLPLWDEVSWLCQDCHGCHLHLPSCYRIIGIRDSTSFRGFYFYFMILGIPTRSLHFSPGAFSTEPSP